MEVNFRQEKDGLLFSKRNQLFGRYVFLLLSNCTGAPTIELWKPPTYCVSQEADCDAGQYAGGRIGASEDQPRMCRERMDVRLGREGSSSNLSKAPGGSGPGAGPSGWLPAGGRPPPRR